jgi:type I restriction enzyme S subunit
MKEWKEYKLKDLVDLKQGFALNKKSDHYLSHDNSGLPLLKISDLINGTETLFVKNSIPKQFLVYPNEIIYSRTGQVGLAFMGKTGVVYNNCFKVIPNNKVYPIYLFHWLNNPRVREIIQSLATGAAQPDLNHDAFKSVGINLPPLHTQKRIAAILSSYDDLIENNLKRIKLLEEIAQRTYEEWFVKFRVNGEQLPIDEDTGLPLGWSSNKLVEVAILTMGQSPKSEFYNTSNVGLPFHQGVSDYGFRFPENSTWSTQGNRNAEKGDILFSVRAPVGRLNIAIEKIILGRGLASIRHKTGLNNKLYYQLQNIFFKDNLIGGGAIFNSVTKNDVERIEVVIANEHTEFTFNSIVSDIDKQIEILTLQIRLLKQSRDILLPRLMSGTINVES